MIQRDDILSMEYLKKTEFTGCHQGMRYRLEQTQAPEDPEGDESKTTRFSGGLLYIYSLFKMKRITF